MKNTTTILVVDDELMMRKLVDKILSRDGYRVLQAEHGGEAMEILKKERVEIIVSDINMPTMNGFDLLRAVKQQFPTISMIMMTAYGDTYSVKDALLLGADEYVTKPFKTHELALIVERTYWRVLSAQQATQTSQ